MLIREHYVILVMKSRLVPAKKSLYREKHDSIKNAFFFYLNILPARNKISSALNIFAIFFLIFSWIFNIY